MKRTTVVVVAFVLGLMQLAQVGAAGKVVLQMSQITTEYKGKIITVQGAIASERAFKGGMRFGLSDGTGEVTLVLFDKTLKAVPKRNSLMAGAVVTVTGKIDFYEQQAQIVPVRGTDVVLVSAAKPVTPTAISAISSGADALVQGVVTEAGNFSAGFKLTLSDDTGKVTVTLFEKTFDSLADADKVNVGATLRVSGRVDEYRGALEIVPGKVEVVEMQPREVKTYALGAISGNDHNAIVQVAGKVTALEPFETGVDAVVTDESGAQRIRLWNVVAKRVPVKEGDSVMVIGRVRASKKGITIDVAMPGDLQIVK